MTDVGEKQTKSVQTIETDVKLIQNWQGETIYFNGFVNLLGAGDFTIGLKRGDRVVAVLNASYTTAKTLAVKLMELIKTLENQTGNTIMTVDQVKEGLAEKSRKQDEPKH